jgi:hypothetical protein
MDRRRFCGSVAGLIVGSFIPRLPFGTAWSAETISGGPDYFVLNGWVLTREDLGTMEWPHDAVRLQ